MILKLIHLYWRDANIDLFTVVAGSVLLSQGGDVHEIAKITYHKKYIAAFKGYDVAILKVWIEFYP